jgi:hypothetical protein
MQRVLLAIFDIFVLRNVSKDKAEKNGIFQFSQYRLIYKVIIKEVSGEINSAIKNI